MIPSAGYIAEKLALLGAEGIAGELRRQAALTAVERLRDLRKVVLDNLPTESRAAVAYAFDLAEASGELG